MAILPGQFEGASTVRKVSTYQAPHKHVYLSTKALAANRNRPQQLVDGLLHW
mgnify:CR=1 FL=1